MSSLSQSENLVSLLSLPDHLRKTLLAMHIEGVASAETIAKHTNRARAVESAYLNNLVLMGMLEKSRKHRHVLFKLRHNIGGYGKRSLWNQVRKMPAKFRNILCEDMLTAFQNRVDVFTRIRHN